MINYDNLEKIGEYKDGYLTWLTEKETNIVYLIQIGEENYVGSTTNLRRRFAQYVADLTHAVYCSPRVQNAFNENESFIIYALERIQESAKLRDREQFFMNLISPELNTKEKAHTSRGENKKENRSMLRVKEICRQKGISQAELAGMIGITEVGLSKSLNGNPNISRLEEIATALGVSVTDLFDKPTEGVIHCPHCGKEIKLNPEV